MKTWKKCSILKKSKSGSPSEGSYEHKSISRCFLVAMKRLSFLLNKLHLKNFIPSHCNTKEWKLILICTSALPPFEVPLDRCWQSILFPFTNILTSPFSPLKPLEISPEDLKHNFPAIKEATIYLKATCLFSTCILVHCTSYCVCITLLSNVFHLLSQKQQSLRE